MPGKNSKQTSSKTETPVAPVEAKVENTVAQTPVETAPAQQKGGKKNAKAATAAPAKTVETPAPVKAAETPAPAQKGGKKAAKTTEAPAASKTETPAPAQKGASSSEATSSRGKKAVAKAAPVETPAASTASAAPVKAKATKKAVAKTETPAQQKGGKRTAKAQAAPAEAAEDAEGEESGDRRIRSFKVRLPGKEEYEGRFTGLTPYQAANKALSKYFRETEQPKTEITFSICESTRKSKKAVYTYVGRRQKLDEPVSYKIQSKDDKGNDVVREIVKNFKNSLKKVKKSENQTESA